MIIVIKKIGGKILVAEKQIQALEAVVLKELELRKNFDTVGCDEIGLPPEYETIIRSLIEEEKAKPINARSINRVMREFNMGIKTFKADNKMASRSLITRRGIKQREELGLSVFKAKYFEHIVLENGNKVFFLSSVNKEDPRIKFHGLVNQKDQLHDRSPDFLVVTQIGENGGGNVLRAIIHVRWEDISETQVIFLVKKLVQEFNEVDKNNINSWTVTSNIISNKFPSKMTTGDIIKTIKCLIRG